MQNCFVSAGDNRAMTAPPYITSLPPALSHAIVSREVRDALFLL